MKRAGAKFKKGDDVISNTGLRGTVVDCWEDRVIIRVDWEDEEDMYNYNDVIERHPNSFRLFKESDMPKQKNIKFVYDDCEGKDIRVQMSKCGTLAPIANDVIEGFIREGIQYLMANTDEGSWYTQTGDTLVLVTDDDENTYEVTVATPRSRGYVDVPPN